MKAKHHSGLMCSVFFLAVCGMTAFSQGSHGGGHSGGFSSGSHGGGYAAHSGGSHSAPHSGSHSGSVAAGGSHSAPHFSGSRGGSVAAHSSAPVHVNGFTRKDGAYVAPHYRSAPDGIRANNWSTAPNMNPYTGAQGTRSLAPVALSPRPPAAGRATQTGQEHSGAGASHSGGATETRSHGTSHFAVGSLGTRDSHGRIQRSEAAKREFMRDTGYSHGRPGYVVDHVVPLKRGGADSPLNMQWQTIEDAKQKDKWE